MVAYEINSIKTHAHAHIHAHGWRVQKDIRSRIEMAKKVFMDRIMKACSRVQHYIEDMVVDSDRVIDRRIEAFEM